MSDRLRASYGLFELLEALPAVLEDGGARLEHGVVGVSVVEDGVDQLSEDAQVEAEIVDLVLGPHGPFFTGLRPVKPSEQELGEREDLRGLE